VRRTLQNHTFSLYRPVKTTYFDRWIALYCTVSSFCRLEQRLIRDSITASEYREFLAEYETLVGPMIKSPSTEIVKPEQTYYIPHHTVLRDSSTTIRLRMIFNALCSSNGTSLNDHMLIGPKFQRNLATVLMQRRKYRYVFTADIAKMYRQILVDSQDTDYCIVWQPIPDRSITDYCLLTVLRYSRRSLLSPSGLKATRRRWRCWISVPLVPVLCHQTYIDDCAFGADQILARQTTRNQLLELLKKGGFRLRKWASNIIALLSELDPADHGLTTQVF